jgi:hypothetical protein
MTTFIEQYGLVQFTRGSFTKYPVTGPCEVINCAEYRRRGAEEWAEETLRRLSAYLADFTEMVELGILTESAVRPIGDIVREKSSVNKRPRANPYVLDHCHRHGWIRGVICRSCNVAPPLCETTGDYVDRRRVIGQPDYWSHLMKCPDCDIRESDIETVELPKFEPLPSPPPGLDADYPAEWFIHRYEVRQLKPSRWVPSQSELVSWHNTLEAAQLRARGIKLKHRRRSYVIRHVQKMKPAALGRTVSFSDYDDVVGIYSDTDNFQPVPYIPLRRGSTDLPQDDGLEWLLRQGERERARRAKRAITA